MKCLKHQMDGRKYSMSCRISEYAPFSDCSLIYISIKLTFQCSKWFEKGHTAEDNGRSRLGPKSSNF